jgi:ribonuclease R
VLNRAVGLPEAPMINDLVLRAQAQAAYSTANIGHFGLALPRYAHFTSPIRRYADLLVNRALLGEALPSPTELADIAAQVSATERRAVAAERAALDRYRARFCSGMIGSLFAARISGVARFGLFVTVADSGADGLVPIGSLPPDFYRHDAKRMRLTGRQSRRQFAIGDAVAVRLVEADAIGGRLLFRLEGDEPAPARAPPRHRRTHLHRRR